MNKFGEKKDIHNWKLKQKRESMKIDIYMVKGGKELVLILAFSQMLLLCPNQLGSILWTLK